MKFNEIKNLQENKAIIKKLEDRESALSVALGQAEEITRDIKRDRTLTEILSRLGTLAEEVGLELDPYQESRVRDIHNQLESEVYELEEIFKDALMSIKNKIEELEEEY